MTKQEYKEQLEERMSEVEQLMDLIDYFPWKEGITPSKEINDLRDELSDTWQDIDDELTYLENS